MSDSIDLLHRHLALHRIRGLQSRSNHLALAYLVLTGSGMYVTLAEKQLLMGAMLLLAGNGLLVWSIDLLRRARRLITQYEQELNR